MAAQHTTRSEAELKYERSANGVTGCTEWNAYSHGYSKLLPSIVSRCFRTRQFVRLSTQGKIKTEHSASQLVLHLFEPCSGWPRKHGQLQQPHMLISESVRLTFINFLSFLVPKDLQCTNTTADVRGGRWRRLACQNYVQKLSNHKDYATSRLTMDVAIQ